MSELLSHSLSSECREVSGLWGSHSPKTPTCCPTAFQEIQQVQTLPECRANQGEKPSEAAGPTREECLKAQQQVAKQGAPNLPANGIGAVSEKVSELKGLLDLLEEDLDVPARAVEVGHAARTPVHVIGEKFHFPLDALNLDQSTHPTHACRVFTFVGSSGRENDLLVGKNFRIRDCAAFDDLELVAAFGAADPEDSPQEEVVEMGKIDVGLVKDDDLSGLDSRADLSGSLGIVVAGRVDEDETGQEALEIEPHVALGGRLAPAVLGPVHASGHQLDGRGVHNVNGLAETASYAPSATSLRKVRRERIKVTERGPKKLFGQLGLSLLARMGESVSAGRSRPANRGKRSTMEPQRVTHVIETNGVCQLGVEHGNDMAPGRKCSAGLVHPSLSRQLRHEMRRNEIAELSQNAELGCRWAGLFFHTLPSGRFKCPRPSNLHLFSSPLWDGCEIK